MTGRMRVGLAWLLFVPFLLFSRPTLWSLLVASGLCLCGLAIRGWAAGTIDKNETLATAGPYAYTRHPLYLGSSLIGAGIALAGGHWGWLAGFLAFFAVAYIPTVRRESVELSSRFGDAYREYAARVPAFGIRMTPYRRGTTDSEERFRLRRYLRYREWEALLGVAGMLGVLAVKVGLGAGP